MPGERALGMLGGVGCGGQQAVLEEKACFLLAGGMGTPCSACSRGGCTLGGFGVFRCFFVCFFCSRGLAAHPDWERNIASC